MSTDLLRDLIRHVISEAAPAPVIRDVPEAPKFEPIELPGLKKAALGYALSKAFTMFSSGCVVAKDFPVENTLPFLKSFEGSESDLTDDQVQSYKAELDKDIERLSKAYTVSKNLDPWPIGAPTFDDLPANTNGVNVRQETVKKQIKKLRSYRCTGDFSNPIQLLGGDNPIRPKYVMFLTDFTKNTHDTFVKELNAQRASFPMLSSLIDAALKDENAKFLEAINAIK